MEERPLQTLNLIDTIPGVRIPSNNSSSSCSRSNAPHQRRPHETEEHHRQLCLAASTFTLHQSSWWPPTTSNKRRREMLEETETNRTKRPNVAQLHDFHRLKEVANADENHVTLNLWPSEHLQQQQRLLQQRQAGARQDAALYEIKKNLKQSDLGKLSRLLVPKGELVKNQFDDEFMTKVKSEEGVQVTIVDDDVCVDKVYQLTFKQLKSSTSYVFNGKWVPLFVTRRRLKKNDEIGFHWDPIGYKFHFSVLNRAAPPAIQPIASYQNCMPQTLIITPPPVE